MEIGTTSFAQTQELLLKLIQALIPLTEKAESASFFLQQRFLPVDPNFYSRHSIHPMKTLYSVQAQVAALTGPKNENNLEKDPLLVKSVEEAAQQSDQPPKKNSDQRLSKDANSTPDAKLPLAQKAQRLINEVQASIAKLLHSNYLKNPEERPLLETLKKLKPQLDKLIEEVSSKDDISLQVDAPFTRHKVARPIREYLISKHYARPEDRLFSSPGQTIVKAPSRPSETTSPEKNVPTQGEGRGERTPRPRAQEVFMGLWKGAPERIQERIVPPQQITVAGIPFTPETKRDPREKKKKRNAFWFREQREEKDSSDHS